MHLPGAWGTSFCLTFSSRGTFQTRPCQCLHNLPCCALHSSVKPVHSQGTGLSYQPLCEGHKTLLIKIKPGCLTTNTNTVYSVGVFFFASKVSYRCQMLTSEETHSQKQMWEEKVSAEKYVQREYKELGVEITLESSSTWQASPSGRCGLPSVLSRHSHVSEDFRGCPQHVPRSEKGSGVSRLEEECSICY